MENLINKNVIPLNTNSFYQQNKKVYETALSLNSNGLNPLFVFLGGENRGNFNIKCSFFKWKKYQSYFQNADDINKHFESLSSQTKIGLAIICGKVSGNVECLDFDNKLNNADEIFNKWTNIKPVNDILKKNLFPIERTLSGGFHVWYKCEFIQQNQKLAHITVDKIQNKIETIIETRGEGGYCITAPSEGYELINGDFADIPIITPDERETLFIYSRMFDDTIIPERVTYSQNENSKLSNDNKKIGDLFQDLPNTKFEIKELLLKAGYNFCNSNNKGDFFTRPYKKGGVSACYNGNTFFVFSSNDPYFTSGRAYNNFQIFTFLKHNGDFKAAAKELANRDEFKEVYKKTPNNLKNDKTNIKYFLIITQTDKGTVYKIDYALLESVLVNYGYKKYRYDNKKTDFILVNKQIIKIVGLEDILYFIKTLFDGGALSFITEKIPDIKRRLEIGFLPLFDGKINKNTKDKKYLYFKNKFAVVNKNYNLKTNNDYELIKNYQILDYSHLEGFIWEDMKLDHEIKDQDTKKGASDFLVFMMKISGLYDGNKLKNDVTKNDLLHYYALKTGFAQYFDDSYIPDYKMIILYDQRDKGDNDINKSNGRAGKTLLSYALKYIVKRWADIDGRTFDKNNAFAFQRVQRQTQVIIFDDLQQNFDLSYFYSAYSTGLTVNKKGEPAFKFEPDENPKIIFNTNFTVKTVNSSDIARIKELELFPYYSVTFSPRDDFGYFLFKDWNEQQWSDFYFDCLDMLQLYTDYGLIDYELINVLDRKAIQILGEVLHEVVTLYFIKDLSNEVNICDLKEDDNGLIRVNKDNFYKYYFNVAKADGIKNALIKQTVIKKVNDFLKLKKIEFKEIRSGNNFYWLLNKDDFQNKVIDQFTKVEEKNYNYLPQTIPF